MILLLSLVSYYHTTFVMRFSVRKVDKRVLAYVDTAKEQGLPVTRSTIVLFGHSAKKTVLDAGDPNMTARDKQKLEAFLASDKWAKNFIHRNGLNGDAAVPHGTAGVGSSSDQGQVDQTVDMEEIREARIEQGQNSPALDEVGTTVRNSPLVERAEGPGPTTGTSDSGDERGHTLWRRQEEDGDKQGSLEGGPSEEEEESRPAPPPFSKLAQHFGVLEEFAESCGVDDAVDSLRRARSAFFRARSSWSAWRAGQRKRRVRARGAARGGASL